jgi:hypothetical protein
MRIHWFCRMFRRASGENSAGTAASAEYFDFAELWRFVMRAWFVAANISRVLL